MRTPRALAQPFLFNSGGGGGGGAQGPQGPQGAQGAQGSDGQSTSFYDYKVKTTITSGDPGSTYLIYNNATQTSATQINVSHLDKSLVDIDIFLALIKDNDVITIQHISNSNDFQKWEVNGTPTMQTGYIEIPVVLLSSGGTGTTNFSNNDDVFLALSFVGPQGPQGPQGPIVGQLDGGLPDSTYGGILPLDAGGVS